MYYPGTVFPGVIGAICLLLAFFALQVLPVNYVGILLMVLALILFVLELKVHSMGLISIAAIICLTLGSVMLFETEESAMRVSWTIIAPTVAAISFFFIVCLGLVVRARLRKPRTGSEGLIGEVGVALTDLDGEGKVSVQGTYWTARADSRIPRGERIRVTRVDGLTLSVTRDAGSTL
jgi:membrane-bound serine protease (ClpP class)